MARPSIPTDDKRCDYTTRGGKRCRMARLAGGFTTLCYFHHDQATSKKIEPHPGFVAPQILSADESLDSAQAVNAALTRVFRLVTEGQLSTRHATTLAYLGQLILATLPQMKREALPEPGHPSLGADPEATLSSLVDTLQSSVRRDASTEHKSNGASLEAPASRLNRF